jgi:ferric-dicitrate binding protein FerR (iron transport regulator)
MAHDIDSVLDQLAQHVHAPRGKQADREQVYAQLQQRMERVETSPRLHPARRTMFRLPRYAVAASIVLGVCFIVTAACLIYTDPIWHASDGPEPTPSQVESAPQEMAFQQTPMSQIVKQLADSYQTSVRISSPELADYQVTATFSPDEPLEEILSALAIVAQCNWQKTEEGYVVY